MSVVYPEISPTARRLSQLLTAINYHSGCRAFGEVQSDGERREPPTCPRKQGCGGMARLSITGTEPFFRDGVCSSWPCADAGGGLGAGVSTNELIAAYEPANVCVQSRFGRAWRTETDGQGPRVRLAYLIVPAWDAHLHGGLGYTRSQICKRRVLAIMARGFPSRYDTRRDALGTTPGRKLAH